MRRIATLILFLATLSVPVSAQLTDYPLGARTDDASLIVVAEVLVSESYWSADRVRLLTRHQLQVETVHKGERLERIELVTLGGTVGDQRQVVEPSLKLQPGDRGLFFLQRHRPTPDEPERWIAVGGPHGWVRFDPLTGAASDPFNRFADMQRELFEPIAQRTGMSAIRLHSPTAQPVTQRLGVPTITSFNPTTISGGVLETLTIQGNGFGSQTGSAAVFFDDPDDGPGGSLISASSLNIVSWSDTQIEVLVPSTAGTGSFAVQDAGGMATFSSMPLTVDYAINDIVSGIVYRLSHYKQNNRGGYTYRYSTSTANGGVDFTSNSEATARFEEAIDAWNCATGWYGDVDGTTTVQTVADDGINIVAFDNNADPISGGTLGRATSFYSSCGGDSWHLVGLDIRFRRDGSGVDWFFGANEGDLQFNEHDFYSVALHEVGHHVQHGHINDANDVMYFALTNGQAQRTLTNANINGGVNIVGYSNSFSSCSRTGMLPFTCNVAPTAAFSAAPNGACGSTLDVDFSDDSLNGPTMWSWDFGDSNSSSQRNPTHQYNGQGIYSVSMTATNSNGSDTRDIDNLIVLTNDPTVASCNPTFTGHNSCCAIGIFNVSLETINRTSVSVTSGDPLQEDLSCSQFAVLEPGQSYPISITTGPANDETVHVYVDWNDDGTLAASELAFSSTARTDHAGTLTVPMTAVQDTALRMRVLSDFAGAGVSSSCDNVEFGQVEEYSVLVTAAVAPAPGQVPAPTLALGKGTNREWVDLSWSASCGAGASDYTVHEGTLGSWYSHTSQLCTSGGSTSVNDHIPQSGSRYFLVVPISSSAEGSYGTRSSGVERPVSTSVCEPAQDLGTSCP